MLITLKLLNLSMLKNVSFVILLLKICLIFGQKKSWSLPMNMIM